MKRLLFLTSLLYISFFAYGKGGCSPYSFGLKDAKNGIERYWAIYYTHTEAVRRNSYVDYKGIHKIEIEIPSDARSIPLTEKTNFCGLKLYVKNVQKEDFTLFVLEKPLTEINVDKSCFSSFSFEDYSDLCSRMSLLIVEDNNPWVENRIGFEYGATRRDVLLLSKGIALNRPICPYDNDNSSPRCFFVKASGEKKYFRNLEFFRDNYSTCKTFLLRVKYVNNFEIRDIKTYTPSKGNWNADAIIKVENCTNININNITIDNTYSQENRFGYAFALGNIWNLSIKKVKAVAKWGIFGCSNINNARLSDCYINRFDLHCYGKDYYLKRCTILDQMPISSMFGNLIFNQCTFETAYPCLYRDDYNAYTPFCLTYNKCIFKMDKTHNFIVYISKLSDEINRRKELERKCIPNVTIKDCIFKLDESLKSFDIIHIGNNMYTKPIGHISEVIIDGVEIKGEIEDVNIVNHNIETLNSVSILVSNVKVDSTQIPFFYININNRSQEKRMIKSNKAKLRIEE